jgi:hypothetical protein
MEDVIDQIVEELKDYRVEENHKIDNDRVRNWINQFNEDDRNFILEEMLNIFKKRYCTKKEGIFFLKQTIDFLVKRFKYNNPKSLLEETEFLTLQESGKSQSILLGLLKELLRHDYDYDFENHSPKFVKNYLYIDDILCTGNTLYQDMFEWLNEIVNDKRRIENIQEQGQRIIFSYIFLHNKNFHKKLAQMKFNISDKIKDSITMGRWIEIDNNSNKSSSHCEVAKPLNKELSARVNTYKDEVCKSVDEYAGGKYPVAEDFFRPNNIPAKEDLFTTPENRNRLEKILLEKGIEILDNTDNITKQQMRALGYSLPSFKDFGFGALCFTWRNVPNNTPLVFWYAGGGFFPLFEKHTIELDINALIASWLK